MQNNDWKAGLQQPHRMHVLKNTIQKRKNELISGPSGRLNGQLIMHSQFSLLSSKD